MVDIERYKGLYSISKRGDIFSHRKGRLLKTMCGTNYYYVRLYSTEGKPRTETIHRLLAETFLENPKGYDQVNHIDGNKRNNDINNLEWCNCSQNVKHSYMKGLSPTGSNKPNTYLSEVDVLFIRLWANLGYSKASIARAFKSTHSCVPDIVKRRSWIYL